MRAPVSRSWLAWIVVRRFSLAGLVFVAGCAMSPPAANVHASASSGPIDSHATRETRALYENLRTLARSHVLFGHQDDLAYGHDWFGDAGRSDVKESSGDYPAVYGWDAGGLEHDRANNIDGVPFARMREMIQEGFARGGVITISWHMDNPTSRGNAWDTTAAVRDIVPGGRLHEQYKGWLDRFATFATSLHAKGPTGEDVLVPVVFRPFHEMSGAWFWWGRTRASPEEYVQLWRFTTEYLRDVKGVHNLLYSYAPNVDGQSGHDHYMDFYPGDAYVDVLGFDEYFRPGQTDAVGSMASHLAWVVSNAESRGKIPALTETGFETVPDSAWWTGSLLRAIKSDSVGRRIAWVLVWRNANSARMKREHYYAPYRGHPSAADFVRFRADPLIMFESELPQLYRLPR